MVYVRHRQTDHHRTQRHFFLSPFHPSLEDTCLNILLAINAQNAITPTHTLSDILPGFQALCGLATRRIYTWRFLVTRVGHLIYD